MAPQFTFRAEQGARFRHIAAAVSSAAQSFEKLKGLLEETGA
jgi:hypothetical protein